MMMKNSKKNAGFTLPELMVSMVIAAIVMTMAISIYVDMKKQYIRLNDKHEINTNNLLIKQIFFNSISHAGFVTKYGDLYQQLVDNSGDNFGDIFGKMGIITIGKVPIQGVQSLPKGLTLSTNECKKRMLDDENLRNMNINEKIYCVQPGTDFLMIQRSTLDSTLKTNSSNNNFKINNFQKNVFPEKNLKPNDYLVLCNADECQLVKVASVGLNFISTTKLVEDKFKEGDYVGKYILEVFFVANSGKKDKSGKDIYSLYEYVKQNSDDSEVYELVDNVSDLKIEYILNSDIHQGNSNLNWRSIKNKPIKITSDKVAALKIYFKVSGKTASKIFLLDQV
ncbi:MAG: prepilin-type N-terminal cleavage/methylation domain-containing protein [Francisella sp.]